MDTNYKNEGGVWLCRKIGLYVEGIYRLKKLQNQNLLKFILK